MAITLNLTAVLITAIICLTLCFIYKAAMAAEGENEEEKKPQEELKGFQGTPTATTQPTKNIIEYMEERARREGKTE